MQEAAAGDRQAAQAVRHRPPGHAPRRSRRCSRSARSTHWPAACRSCRRSRSSSPSSMCCAVSPRTRPGLYSWSDDLTDEAARAKLFGAPISVVVRHRRAPRSRRSSRSPVAPTATSASSAFVLIVIMCFTTFFTQKQIMSRSGPVEGQAATVQKFHALRDADELSSSPASSSPSASFSTGWHTDLWTLGQQFFILRKLTPPGSAAHKAKADADKPYVDPKTLAPQARCQAGAQQAGWPSRPSGSRHSRAETRRPPMSLTGRGGGAAANGQGSGCRRPAGPGSGQCPRPAARGRRTGQAQAPLTWTDAAAGAAGPRPPGETRQPRPQLGGISVSAPQQPRPTPRCPRSTPAAPAAEPALPDADEASDDAVLEDVVTGTRRVRLVGRMRGN